MNPTTLRYQQLLEQLRNAAAAAVGRQWDALPAYDQADVDAFLNAVLPIITAAQTSAVRLTDAYMAQMMRRAPLGLDVETLIGAAVRNGTLPADVYARPFVMVWSALQRGDRWRDAVDAGRGRLLGTAQMDVALSTRAAASQIGERDDRIVGYQRVPDGGACDFCDLVSGQRYTTDQLMPLHNNCGCTVEPIEASERHHFTGVRAHDLSIPVTEGDVSAVVREHGELGPVLVDAHDHFTDAEEAAA